ncbi:MAG: hypothetical protein HUJ70_14710 [Pseudobutyrivibrio sp.]|nr:hypothetical protein [Pseudobutyrivibrio sp.]
MNSYFIANVKRTLNKSYRYVFIILGSTFLFGVCAEASQLTGGLTDSAMSIINGMMYMGVLLFGVFFGIMEICYVFTDDFKARMQQAAIGVGTTRARVIFTKYMEFVVYLTIDIILMNVMFVVSALSIYGNINEVMIKRLIGFDIAVLIMTLSCASFTVLFLYIKDNVLIGVMIFLVVNYATQASEKFNEFLNGLPGMGKHHIGEYLIFYQNRKFASKMVTGTFDIRSFLVIAFEMALIIALTCHLFKKKELDF